MSNTAPTPEMPFVVRKSRLTGDWVLNPGRPYSRRFRSWEDATTEAEKRAERVRDANRRAW